MASNQLVILAIVSIFLPSIAMATDFIVGDDKGWTLDFDYKAWAKDKVFYVGDNLIFNYPADKHNVFKVNQTQYKDCAVPPPNEGLGTGKDVITLSKAGPKWYICGYPDHCANHTMKLAITVTANAPEPTPNSAVLGNVFSGYKIFIAVIVAAVAIVA